MDSSNKHSPTDPFAPRLTPTFSATLAPPTPTSTHTPRSVSITMEDYITDGKDEQDLDLNMIHDFGAAEGVGVDMRDFTNHNDDHDEQDDAKDGILGKFRSLPL
ncbi:uncharacterized protein I206_105103 [Kwoniella pini CBS 10737]|uniref:Uncharacterized protein n=1 Tax=Kwoniella pini CBS 10737 TaxID=1296096 RepID=A0A1B9I8M2_9TREE|nr:uncharacterized protein I206_02644 [Kwoniella pini CBS 10737]OCF51928.1 hypothetical protein I206_02644 [Kwoniella pini CBS 10737]